MIVIVSYLTTCYIYVYKDIVIVVVVESLLLIFKFNDSQIIFFLCGDFVVCKHTTSVYVEKCLFLLVFNCFPEDGLFAGFPYVLV